MSYIHIKYYFLYTNAFRSERNHVLTTTFNNSDFIKNKTFDEKFYYVGDFWSQLRYEWAIYIYWQYIFLVEQLNRLSIKISYIADNVLTYDVQKQLSLTLSKYKILMDLSWGILPNDKWIQDSLPP